MYSVILVDDEKWVLDTLKTYIEQNESDFNVIGAYLDAESTLEALSKEASNIIIIDIQMFGMSGLELAKHVSQNYPDTIIFMCSAYRNFDYARAAIKYGVNQYLLKPIDFEELSEALHAAASQLDTQKKTDGNVVPMIQLPPADTLSPLVTNALHYISKHYQSDLSRDDIAKASYSSAAHLSRTFKQQVGIGLMDYLMQYRILKSIELLKAGMHVADISSAVGYQNYKTFLAHFKQYTNMLPSDYRQTMFHMEDDLEK